MKLSEHLVLFFRWSILPTLAIICLGQVLLYPEPKVPEPVKTVKKYTPRYDTRAHQMVALELEYNATTAIDAARAYYMLDMYIDRFSGREVIEDRENLLGLFSEVAQAIDEHYTYKAHGTMSMGLSHGFIDCDLRSYLYLAIAEQLGLEKVSIIFQPAHALIAWNDTKKGELVGWETTITGGRELKQERFTTEERTLFGHYRPATQDQLFNAMVSSIAVNIWDNTEDVKKLLNLYTGDDQGAIDYRNLLLAYLNDSSDVLINVAENYPAYAVLAYGSAAQILWDKNRKEEAKSIYANIIYDTYDEVQLQHIIRLFPDTTKIALKLVAVRINTHIFGVQPTNEDGLLLFQIALALLIFLYPYRVIILYIDRYVEAQKEKKKAAQEQGSN